MKNGKALTREEADTMTDRLLLAAYVDKEFPGSLEHGSREQILRNGRWGTCAGCPRDAQGIHPENCPYTERYDHNIHSTHDGKFYYHDREISKSSMIYILVS